jgi:hypothetical protein
MMIFEAGAMNTHPIVIKLALPPAAAVLTDMLTSSTSQLRQ